MNVFKVQKRFISENLLLLLVRKLLEMMRNYEGVLFKIYFVKQCMQVHTQTQLYCTALPSRNEWSEETRIRVSPHLSTQNRLTPVKKAFMSTL